MSFHFDCLCSLLRRPFDDAAVLELIGGDCSVIERDEHYGSIVFKAVGAELVLKEASYVLPAIAIVDARKLYVCAFHLHRGGHEGFDQYAGRLPGGIGFGDTKEAVQRTLGEPAAAGGGGMNPVLRRPIARWIRYTLENGALLNLQFDGAGTLEMVTVESAGAEGDYQKHDAFTAIRRGAYAALFGGAPSYVFTPRVLYPKPDERFLIDVFVYTFATAERDIEVAVTNGMSDQRMVDARDPRRCSRRELIQYFPKCTENHARRLYDMAWLPLFDGFLLDSQNSVAWHSPAVEGTPWKNAFFLAPMITSHRDFVCEVGGDPVTFLWHIPISDDERAYKLEHGADALIGRMDEASLSWVFDEVTRPRLV